MFDWLDMIGNYEQRKVDNFKTDMFEVDTALVTDRAKPYETAVKHEMFNDGEWIVLEWSGTKEEAQAVHNKWVEFFKHGNVNEITDCFTGETFKADGVQMQEEETCESCSLDGIWGQINAKKGETANG